LKSGVVTVATIHGGIAVNVIPETLVLEGTARSLEPAVRDLLEKRVCETAKGIATAYGALAQVDYGRNYPVTVNHPRETDFAVKIARQIAGADKVIPAMPPVMGAEDFSFMLEACPGNMIFIGNGDTAGLHHPAYDFNDAAIPYGVSYWARLAETAMPS
jgi:metal-dependent amidase/aminoacylase/carboxypeptidase family protein